MTFPDPNRLGGLEWSRRTRGNLTAAERRHLIGAIAVGQATHIVGRVKLARGRLHLSFELADRHHRAADQLRQSVLSQVERFATAFQPCAKRRNVAHRDLPHNSPAPW